MYTGWTEWGNICGKTACTLYSPDDGFGLTGYSANGNANITKRAETIFYFPIRASSSKLRYIMYNAELNWGTTANQSDLAVSLAAQIRVGGSPSGAYSLGINAVNVLAGTSYISDDHTVTVSSGTELAVDCYVDAYTVGKYCSGTQQHRTPKLGAIGNALVATLDGSVSTNFGNEIAFTAGAVLGLAKTPRFVGLGHSLITAIQNFGDSGPCIGADMLNVPYSCIGRGGSIPTAWSNTADYETIRLLGTRALVLAMVNAINNYAGNANMNAFTGAAIPTSTGTGQTTSLADVFRNFIRRVAPFGIRIFALTENYPGTGASARQLEVWHYWNEWLVNNAAAYCGAILTGVIDTRPYFASTPYINGVPLATPGFNDPNPAGDDIHYNWIRFGTAVFDYFKPGGPGAAYNVADSNNYVQAAYELFQGPSTTPGATALPNNWYEWYYTGSEARRLCVDGVGNLKVVNPTTKSTYALSPTPLGGSNAEKEFVARAVSHRWVAQSDDQGLIMCFHAVPGTGQTTDIRSGFNREGYFFKFSNNTTNLRMHANRYNSDDTGGGNNSFGVTTLTGQALAAGDILTVEITRRLTGGNNVFTVYIYKNGLLINTGGNPITITDAGTTAKYQGVLYPSIGTGGNTATTHTNNAATWDYFSAANYDATVIDAITASTIKVPKGGRVAFNATVTQSAPIAGPAAGVLVTTSWPVPEAGISVGANANTDGSGVARFADGSGVTALDSVLVGTTTTLRLTCGGVTADVTVEVVSSCNCTGGGGSIVVGGNSPVMVAGAINTGGSNQG